MNTGSQDDKRVGDATLQRIDDLAGGWSVPRRARSEAPDPSPAPEARPPESRGLAKSTPAPASASADKTRTRGILSKKKSAAAPAAREKTRARGKERGKTVARRSPGDPPIPFLGVARGTEQPPVGPGSTGALRADVDERSETEVSDRATTRALDREGDLERAETRALDRGESESERAETRALDRGESESERAETRALTDHVDPELLDHAATTIYKDRSSVDVIPSPAQLAPLPLVSPVSRTDETMLQPPGADVYAVPVERKTGAVAVLRKPPTLPRRRGVFGDMLYLYTASVGVGRARRELAGTDRKLEAERKARQRRLADLARLAVADSALQSDTLTAGREEIIEIEDQRSRVDGAAAAAEAEIASLERDRSDEKKKHAQEQEKLRRATVDTDEKLEPLQRRLRAVWRRVARLQESMLRLDDRLTRAAARLDGLPAEKRAEAEATIATMRAERQALDQEEPALAAEIDQLEPAIANLTASLADDRARAAQIEEQERAAVARVAEKIAAIKARRVVDERAEEELAEAQQESLRALGERLAVERTDELVPRLRGIEEHEVAIGTLERRHLELTELLYGVDRWTVARGVLWHLAIAVAVAAALVWSVALRVL